MPTAMVPMPVLCQDGTRPANMDVCTIAARLRSKTEATEGVRTPQRPSDLLVVGPWPGAVAEVARELRAEAEAALKGEAARRLEVEEAAGLDAEAEAEGRVHTEGLEEAVHTEASCLPLKRRAITRRFCCPCTYGSISTGVAKMIKRVS